MSAALVIPSLASLPNALGAAVAALQRVGPDTAASTLHVLLNGDEARLCDVEEAAQAALPRTKPGDEERASALTSVDRHTLAAAAAAAANACCDALRHAGA